MQATGELVAGQDLDALVAENVMGWDHQIESWYDEEGLEVEVWVDDEGGRYTHGGGADTSDLPEFSTDIAAAWQVVEKMREQGRDMNLYWEAARSIWIVESWIVETTGANAETAPLAICAAALRAVSRAE